MTNQKQIDELLTRSIEQILPSKEALENLLLSGKKLRIYIGADATGPALHLGHATNFMVLERWRKLGHEVIILIGDFTARIGDPSDKLAARKPLTREEVTKNVSNWLEQLSHFLTFNDPLNPPRVVFNHDWFSKLTFEDALELCSHFTVQQMLVRDMFDKRIKENKPIFLHEFFYPLMQGFDSVVLDVDVELCGRDQLFNAMTGRTLLKEKKNKEKFVILTTLLENPLTKEKMMSKSLGTGIYIDECPNDMFGKIMAQPDENMLQLFTDCTHVSRNEIAEMETKVLNGTLHPRDCKLRLAEEITTIIHGREKATQAKEHFIKVIQQKELPSHMPEYELQDKDKTLIDVLCETTIAKSRSSAQRLIQEHGIKMDGILVESNQPVKKGTILQKGKFTFLKIV